MPQNAAEPQTYDAYDAFASPAAATGTHAIQMEFSQMQSGSGLSVAKTAGSNGYDSTLYDHDLVMIFPRREGGELKKPEEFTMEAFVNLFSGKDAERSKRQSKIVIDTFRRVLLTTRCYLDDMGRDTVMNESEYNESLEQRRLQTEQSILENEYIQFVGSKLATTEALFCELVATSVARRVQLACGLTTRMFRSCDNDEIIMTIKADDNDLRVEADRTDYRLQVSNRPFDEKVHGAKIKSVRQEIGDLHYKESMEHLRQIRGAVPEQNDIPEMDPLLMTKGAEYHPSIYGALQKWGHTEEADGLFPDDDSFRPQNAGHRDRFWSSLLGISYDPMTYFAPYADYRHEEMYQPYYRRYPIKWGGKSEETLFSQKDRIRLAAGIVNRHICTDALEVAGFLNGEMFALHDEAALNDLQTIWALNWTMLNQPLNKIRFYFGEKIALYFAWLGFYTKMLLFPSIAGIITFAYLEGKSSKKGEKRGYILIAFAVFVVIWASVFSEIWKRKNGIFNALWGLHGFHRKLRYRAQFRGSKSYNPLTDEEEMTYESKAKRRNAFWLSIIVVLFMICIVIVALVGLFLLKHFINDKGSIGNYRVNPKYQSAATMGVTGLNAVQILLLNMFYRGVAGKLNDMENHRTDREYENHLVVKVFLFQFCNSFASFFYIAFVKRAVEDTCLYNDDCMRELRDQLLILFVIRIVVGNTLEVVIPYLKYRYKLYQERGSISKADNHNYIEDQAKLLPYESNEAFEDYNEMVVQYGFITLFVVAFPLTPVLALANNLVEVHVDSVKLCFVHRRPFPHPAKSIGAWFYIMRFMSYIALGTNTALILWTSDLLNDSWSNSEKAFIFVVACQVCLMISFMIERAVPDVPRPLVLLMQRHEHIVAMVFKGMFEGDDSGLKETAEALDLTIHANDQWEDKTTLRQHWDT